MTQDHSQSLPDGSHPEAAANARSYAHHRFWAGAFDGLAAALGTGPRQARAAELARQSRSHMDLYAAHLRRYHPQCPIPPERLAGRLARRLMIGTRGVGLSLWAHIARWQERRLRRALLRHYGIDPGARFSSHVN